MKENCTFPETVEHKSCTATIYHQRHREAERFEVRYYDVDGSKQRLTFPTSAVRCAGGNRAMDIELGNACGSDAAE
jgi:hypothetical protein